MGDSNLRQGDAQVFKKYSQMKLQRKREALEKLNRRASEMTSANGEEMRTVVVQGADKCTVCARSRPEIMNRSGTKVGKCFRINLASHVGA
jgi:hypothetical protein